MSTTRSTFDRSAVGASRWTPARLRLAGLAAAVGGLLYALSYLEGNYPALSEGGSLYWLVGPLAIVAYALVFVGLRAVHARHGSSYGRFGAALVALTSVTLAGMAVGVALNHLTPGLADPFQPDATLGGTIWGLAMVATLLLATAYGIVLWRADRARVGAALLALDVPLFVAGLLALTVVAGPLGSNPAWLAFGGPFGLAWVALGWNLRRTSGTDEGLSGATPTDA